MTCKLRNDNREKALESEELCWHVLALSEFVEQINDRIITLLN